MFAVSVGQLTQCDAGTCLNVVSLCQAYCDVSTTWICPCDGERLARDDIEATLRDVDIVCLCLRKRDSRQEGEDQSVEAHVANLLYVVYNVPRREWCSERKSRSKDVLE